jgi:hypothetical protein
VYYNDSARALLDESLVTVLHDADRIAEPVMEEAFDTVSYKLIKQIYSLL